MPRDFQVKLAYNEVEALKKLITNFLNYYIDHENNKTWREWVGNTRPSTLENLETKFKSLLKE